MLLPGRRHRLVADRLPASLRRVLVPPCSGPVAAERILPVPPELAGLFPGGGLPRGAQSCSGGGGAGHIPQPCPRHVRSQLSRGKPDARIDELAVIAASGHVVSGYWCAVAGLPELGLAAAAELGADLDRLVVVPRPGSEGRWQSVVATLLETVDLVCLAPDTPCDPLTPGGLPLVRESVVRPCSYSTRALLPVLRGVPLRRPCATGTCHGTLARPVGPALRRERVELVRARACHGLLSSRQLEAEVGGRVQPATETRPVAPPGLRSVVPPVRTLVVWCPDWPLVAAGLSDRPAVVLAANRVIASSAPARAEGVRLGQRRREAQACCPELVVVGEEPARDARSFEPVVVAVAGFTPRVELTRPGVCALPVRPPPVTSVGGFAR